MKTYFAVAKINIPESFPNHSTIDFLEETLPTFTKQSDDVGYINALDNLSVSVLKQAGFRIDREFDIVYLYGSDLESMEVVFNALPKSEFSFRESVIKCGSLHNPNASRALMGMYPEMQQNQKAWEFGRDHLLQVGGILFRKDCIQAKSLMRFGDWLRHNNLELAIDVNFPKRTLQAKGMTDLWFSFSRQRDMVADVCVYILTSRVDRKASFCHRTLIRADGCFGLSAHYAQGSSYFQVRNLLMPFSNNGSLECTLHTRVYDHAEISELHKGLPLTVMTRLISNLNAMTLGSDKCQLLTLDGKEQEDMQGIQFIL